MASANSMMNFLDTLVYSKHKGIRILRHLLFWTSDAVSYLIVVSANVEIKSSIIFSVLFSMPLAALITYFIIYYLMPTFSKDHNKVRLLIGVVAAFLFIGVGMRYYRFFIVYPIVDPTHAMPASLWGFSGILGEVFGWMSVICMAIAIKLMKNRAELQQKNDQLVQEKKISELNFLKAQMHPHFLFNTLNTLYSDAIQETGRSEQIVLHLSSLLRFMLEECNKPVIPIEKEIKVIEDYIELEKLRHGSRLQIDCQFSVNNKQAFLSPLLFLPFIENSCKHTLSSKRGPILILVKIESDNNFIRLFVENELAQPALNGVTHGIGVANVKRQLELLYDNNFTLDIKKNNNKYAVNLKVPALAEL